MALEENGEIDAELACEVEHDNAQSDVPVTARPKKLKPIKPITMYENTLNNLWVLGKASFCKTDIVSECDESAFQLRNRSKLRKAIMQSIRANAANTDSV